VAPALIDRERPDSVADVPFSGAEGVVDNEGTPEVVVRELEGLGLGRASALFCLLFTIF
jgi:hypothetical protein